MKYQECDREMTRPVTFLLLFCIVAVCTAACCLGSPGTETVTPTATEPALTTVTTAAAGPQPEFSTSVLSLEQHRRIDGTAYRVAMVNIENTGDAAAFNVRVTLRLVEEDTGIAGAPKSKIYERFNAGERKLLSMELDSTWNTNYRLDIGIQYD